MLSKVVSSILLGDLTLDCSILRTNIIIVKNVLLMTKKHSDTKNVETGNLENEMKLFMQSEFQ